ERAHKLEPSHAAAAAPAVPQRASGSVERAALAAIAAAVAPEVPLAAAPLQPASYGDVTVRPIAQKPSLFPDAARFGAPQAATSGRAANRGTGFGICPSARATGTGRSRPPGTCCRGATGRRSFGHPGVPAASGQLKFVAILRTKKVPAPQPGPLFFAREGS